MTEKQLISSLEELYERSDSSDRFVCKYSDCEHESSDETDIRRHCSQHLAETTDDNKTDDSESKSALTTRSQSFEDSTELPNRGNYVCDWFGCNKQFSYLKCFRSHRNEHLVLENKKQSTQESIGANGDHQKADNKWEQYVGCDESDSKEKLYCKWSDCPFRSNLRVVLKQHITSSHLREKRIRSRPKIHNEYEYWDQILFDKRGIRLSSESKSKTPDTTKAAKTPAKTSSPKPFPKPVLTPKAKQKVNNLKSKIEVNSKPKIEVNLKPKIEIISKPKIENELLAKKHLNIDKNKRDVLLSCKGLASMTKVSKYFVKKVINGEKTYFCTFFRSNRLDKKSDSNQIGKTGNSEEGSNRCQFRTKKSQKIAEHINLSHIGVDFKCNKPNCNKVFKNPHSYREHQKNHICGFGSFGYGSKGVIGVCRNENLFKYRERIVIKGKKYYRCKVCFAITKYFTGMKRHIHSQHICPFRMNLHLTRHQTPIAIKQEIMDLDIDFDLFGNQIHESFICCLKCNEFFNSTEELRKHEIMFCRFRDDNIDDNIRNQIVKQFNLGTVGQTDADVKPKLPTNSADNKLKLSEQIRRNVNAINESIAKNLSLDHQLLGLESRESAQKYIVQKFEGIDYYLCKECKFVTKLSDKINEHIVSRHLQTNNSKFFLEAFGSAGFPTKIKIENEENEELADEDIEKPSTSGLQNLQTNYSIEKHIEIKCIDSEPNYFCVANTDCKYYTNDFVEIKTHVKESHLSFECDVENCGKQFKNQTVLNAHKVNHICGFGIKGRKSSGLCSLDNIKKYRDERIINRKMVFPCLWRGCRYISETRNNALSHIHNRHICPNRMLANGTQKTTASNCSKTNATSVPQKSSPIVRQSIDESLYNSSSDECPETGEDMDVLGTFETEESFDNLDKYSQEVTVDEKTVFVCLYPNCEVTPTNRLNFSSITDKYKSYSTHFKPNMIRHIRRHFNCE